MPAPVLGLCPRAGVKGRPRPVGLVHGNPDVSKIQARSPPLPGPAGAQPCPAPSLQGVPGLDAMGGWLLKVSDPKAVAADWVFCCHRRHGSAPLCARPAWRAGPGAVRAVAAGPCGHRVAGGGPGTRTPGPGVRGAGECPGGPGVPRVTLYCKFLQIQR